MFCCYFHEKKGFEDNNYQETGASFFSQNTLLTKKEMYHINELSILSLINLNWTFVLCIVEFSIIYIFLHFRENFL